MQCHNFGGFLSQNISTKHKPIVRHEKKKCKKNTLTWLYEHLT